MLYWKSLSYYQKYFHISKALYTNFWTCFDKVLQKVIEKHTTMSHVSILSMTVGQVSKKYGDDRQILIQLNDLPSNDFKSVWKNIDGELT